MTKVSTERCTKARGSNRAAERVAMSSSVTTSFVTGYVSDGTEVDLPTRRAPLSTAGGVSESASRIRDAAQRGRDFVAIDRSYCEFVGDSVADLSKPLLPICRRMARRSVHSPTPRQLLRLRTICRWCQDQLAGAEWRQRRWNSHQQR